MTCICCCFYDGSLGILQNNFEDLSSPYCTEDKHISLRIHFAHHHHMLPLLQSCCSRDLFHLCGGMRSMRPLGEAALLAINHQTRRRETGLVLNEGLIDNFLRVGRGSYAQVESLDVQFFSIFQVVLLLSLEVRLAF